MDSQLNNLPTEQVEARSAPFVDLDVTKNGRHFDGYAAIYGEEADLGDWIEVIVPPAFRSALSATDNLPMLWDHNASMPPFATTKAGTLIVTEDRRGLRVQAEIDERHILGPTMMSMAERGELHGMSFGFVSGRGNNKVQERAGRVLRSITGFRKLLDVSPTWNPAYAGTTAELRSLAALQSAPVLIPEQVHDGESQSAVDGQDQETTEVVAAPVACESCGKPAEGDDQCACAQQEVEEPEEQRSGAEQPVEFDEAAHAARTRRLQMLGMTLPR
jgi:HK97 family phage prohead protease